jgi:mannose-6-phosphate isomerase-like protein (cupin superfamily)
MNKPIIAQNDGINAIAAAGHTFQIHEWTGSGAGYLHVHFADDEAWHILEGVLTFRFSDGLFEAPAGTTVFVPAGVPHDYFEANGATRYLIILTPRLHQLIEELQKAPLASHAAIMRQFESAIVE